MRYDIAQKPQNKAISTAVKIDCSEALVAAIREQSEASDASLLPYLPRSVVAEARRVSDEMRVAYLAPLPAAALREFVTNLHETLNCVVCNPTDHETLQVRISATCAVLADTPRRVLGDDLTNACLARFKFLPAPAELRELADDMAEKWRDSAAKLRLIALHDEAKRFTLGYAPPEDDPAETPQLTSEQSQTLGGALDGTLGRFKSKREVAA